MLWHIETGVAATPKAQTPEPDVSHDPPNVRFLSDAAPEPGSRGVGYNCGYVEGGQGGRATNMMDSPAGTSKTRQTALSRAVMVARSRFTLGLT